MSEIIDPKKAESLIKEYQEQNSQANGLGLLTPGNEFLKGFFIDRKSLEDVLKHKDVEGVSIYIAKHPDFVDQPTNHFTLVYFGAEPNVAGNPPYESASDIYCKPPPCPPICAHIKK